MMIETEKRVLTNSFVTVANWSFAEQLLGLVETMRPKQWTKNLLIFAGLIFAEHLFDVDFLIRSVAAFGIFSLQASCIYLINDIVDIEKDKTHPLKRLRPLPSGRLRLAFAKAAVPFLSLGGLLAAFQLDTKFGFIVAGYFVLFALYSFFLKNLVILDVMIIAAGFVLRAVAGAVVIDVLISKWLLICTIFLSLFLALCKRRHELIALGNNSSRHRSTLDEYSAPLLDQMVAIVTASTVMAYTLYTTAEETFAKFGTHNLILTVPFVLYGIFRYLYLVYQKAKGGNPEDILIKDVPTLLNIVFYMAAIYLLIYMK
jgi:4-hydroxybenzoate polyprenyltransferase